MRIIKCKLLILVCLILTTNIEYFGQEQIENEKVFKHYLGLGAGFTTA